MFLCEHLPQGILQHCLVGPPCMASRLGGGMGTRMMRILSNRKTGHPQKSMTAPPQVGGCEILNYFTLSEIKCKHVLSWVYTQQAGTMYMYNDSVTFSKHSCKNAK